VHRQSESGASIHGPARREPIAVAVPSDSARLRFVTDPIEGRTTTNSSHPRATSGLSVWRGGRRYVTHTRSHRVVECLTCVTRAGQSWSTDGFHASVQRLVVALRRPPTSRSATSSSSPFESEHAARIALCAIGMGDGSAGLRQELFAAAVGEPPWVCAPVTHRRVRVRGSSCVARESLSHE